jgi:uncharacterized cupredoxin-like copper-binding protein
MNFPLSHIATLCKYTGISFTAGSITHGSFSSERSYLTAAIGICIYLLGGILEKIAHPDKNHSWSDLLIIGIVASIGLGFFTGGLQHFPDSPERSAWVVPVGFVMSLLAMYLMEGKSRVKLSKVLTYGAISFALVTGASLLALNYFHTHGSSHEHDHGHGQTDRHTRTQAHDHGQSSSNSVSPTTPATPMRELLIEADDTMQFKPAVWSAVSGEPVRITLVNKGKVDHELVIGTETEILQHAKDMANPNASSNHHHTNEIVAKPGQRAQLVWTFKEAGTYAMACFETVHYEAGMKGVIKVTAPHKH